MNSKNKINIAVNILNDYKKLQNYSILKVRISNHSNGMLEAQITLKTACYAKRGSQQQTDA